jgi:hypothetical protein
VLATQLIQLTKEYKIMRDLDNKVMNVFQAKLAYEVLIFLLKSSSVKLSAGISAVGFHSAVILPESTSWQSHVWWISTRQSFV